MRESHIAQIELFGNKMQCTTLKTTLGEDSYMYTETFEILI